MGLIGDKTEGAAMANAENLSIDVKVEVLGGFQIADNTGKKLAVIHPDGNVELFGDVNEAAMQFWTIVCQISGGALTKVSRG